MRFVWEVSEQQVNLTSTARAWGEPNHCTKPLWRLGKKQKKYFSKLMRKRTKKQFTARAVFLFESTSTKNSNISLAVGVAIYAKFIVKRLFSFKIGKKK